MKYKLLLFILPVLLVSISSSEAEHLPISQKDKAFDKSVVKAKLGDTLVFKNDEANITHNVFSLSDGNEFELKPKNLANPQK